MICFASQSMVPGLKRLWSVCFGDPDPYIDLYFQERFAPANTLVCLNGEEPAAMLTMLPLSMATPVEEFDARYVFAVATHPDFRGQGLSTRLLDYAHTWMREAGAALSVLVPASDSLFRFYEQRGYQTGFEVKRVSVSREDFTPEGTLALQAAAARLADMEVLRGAWLKDSRMFAKWDAEALAYIDKENAFLGGQILELDGGERWGYAVCYPNGPVLEVKELALDSGFLESAVSCLFKYFQPSTINFRLRADFKTNRKNMVLPFGMVRWYDKKQKEKFSRLSGSVPYLSHVLD